MPTPVVHTRLRAPASRIGPADDVDAAAKASPLGDKYGTREEAVSAREKLAARMDEQAEPDAREPEAAKAPRRKREKKAATTMTAGADAIGDLLTSREGQALQKKVMRGVFGMFRKSL